MKERNENGKKSHFGKEEIVSLESPKLAKPRWAVSNVLALNVATGIVEAVSFAHLGGLFSAFVTGTIVLAGVRLGTGGLATLLPYGVAFVAFVCGAFLGGSLIRGKKSQATIYTRALLVEALALALAAVAALISTEPHESGTQLVTLGLLALGMAVQSRRRGTWTFPFSRSPPRPGRSTELRMTCSPIEGNRGCCRVDCSLS